MTVNLRAPQEVQTFFNNICISAYPDQKDVCEAVAPAGHYIIAVLGISLLIGLGCATKRCLRRSHITPIAPPPVLPMTTMSSSSSTTSSSDSG